MMDELDFLKEAEYDYFDEDAANAFFGGGGTPGSPSEGSSTPTIPENDSTFYPNISSSLPPLQPISSSITPEIDALTSSASKITITPLPDEPEHQVLNSNPLALSFPIVKSDKVGDRGLHLKLPLTESSLTNSGLSFSGYTSAPGSPLSSPGSPYSSEPSTPLGSPRKDLLVTSKDKKDIKQKDKKDKLKNKNGEKKEKVNIPLQRGGKNRLKWTPELNNLFQKAVKKLGAGAVPSAILEEMNVQGLTRENVASHLQKYRLQHKRYRRDLADEILYPEEKEQLISSLDLPMYHHEKGYMDSHYRRYTFPNAAMPSMYGLPHLHHSGGSPYPPHHPPHHHTGSHIHPLQSYHGSSHMPNSPPGHGGHGGHPTHHNGQYCYTCTRRYSEPSATHPSQQYAATPSPSI